MTEQPFSSSFRRRLDHHYYRPFYITKTMDSRFLLVGDNPDSPWAETVREAVRSRGEVVAATAANAAGVARAAAYDMIIVDATAIGDITGVIAALREAAPAAPIVVATASPTWQRAREVFLKGATDYVRKSVDPAAVAAALEAILARSR
jgi:DNA-binding response OmpR family regulator